MFAENVSDCDDIYLADVKFHGYEKSGCVYIIDAEKKAIIETGPSPGLGNVLDALNELDIQRNEVDYIALTHIHLDHAGATGYLAEWCKNAKVVCHEAGVDYLSDSKKVKKLLSSVRNVVGRQARDYGNLIPTDRERFKPVSGGETIDLGDRNIEVLYAPGHAFHHICFYESKDEAFFTGDEAGMWINGKLRPSTPPPNFDLEQKLESLNRMKSYNPKVLLYTHFGARTDAIEALEEYGDFLKNWVSEIEKVWNEKEDEGLLKKEFADRDKYRIKIWDEENGRHKIKTDVSGVLQYIKNKESE